VSASELIDKITILEIKLERIADEAKRANVRRELELLRAARATSIAPSAALRKLETELKAVNGRLWEIENEVRMLEAAGDFGAQFIALARSVYKENDNRAALKRRINEMLGSPIVEEKSYGG
jgi:post-segregation antitoxin (ccd killing protein)